MKVTIMIPTYNQSLYIEQCIDSALRQDYSNLEIIISDDSTDNKTERIVKKKYIDNLCIKYFHNIPSLGRVGNYFHTLNHYATGEWVLNLDGDDFLINESFISHAMKLVERNDDLAMVFGKEKIYDERTEQFILRNTNVDVPIPLNGTEVFLNKRSLGINFFHLSTIYNRKKAINVKFYTDDFLGADTISLMKLLPGNNIAFLNEYGGAWRVHMNNDSFTADVNILVHNIGSLKVIYNYIIKENLIPQDKMNNWLHSSIIIKYETYVIGMILKKQYKLVYKFSELFKKEYNNFFKESIKKPRFIAKCILALLGTKVYKKLSEL